MESTSEEEAFFRVISENMKFAFTSPVPTTTQFPTPYSQQQQHQEQQLLQHQQNQQLGENTSNADDKQLASQSVENQSMVENSMLMNGQGGAAKLSDVNVQPSSALQLGSEFMLTSPDHFKEFLFESPAGFNLWHRTPAKTPLRFFNGSAGNPSAGKSDSMNTGSQNPHNMATPLRSIDVNLMFSSKDKLAPTSASSPSKRYLSLTPYGKRILSDIGTPYAKLLASSNSALVDFQRARKDVIKSSPRYRKGKGASRSKKHLKKPTFSPSGTEASVSSGHALSKHNLASAEAQHGHALEEGTGHDSGLEECGSSPTTIQLNSSVTKSSRNKLGFIANCPPMPYQEDGSSEDDRENIDERLFGIGKLPLSPTPKPASSNDVDVTQLKIPELPKMGSFRSESGSSSSLPSTTKKTTRKQPKFQIIVTNANSFNSTRGTIVGDRSGTKKRKPALKRSQSEIVSTSDAGSKKKGKKQKLSQANSFSIGYHGGHPSSQ
ncbi:LADA_0A08878g1_1 [Lachancea dasiensis]|uniref:LADA_0A08878g1_1 n=1 Tax=Lachancea dasiensis TaxID=1072105 RepID=A0A1G4IQI5_9SACH|nr:LADA_0A08878g1_1 [Lachancea dasiensis]